MNITTRNILLVISIVCFAAISMAQSDSYRKNLEDQLKQNIPDTLRARIYIDLAEYLDNEKEWMPYNQKALALANKHLSTAKGEEQKFYWNVKANAYGNLGYYEDYHGNITKSIDYYFESLKLYDKAGDKAGKAAILGNLGVIYTNRKDFEEALDYLKQALALKLKYDPENVAKNYTNIGVAFEGIGDSTKALEYYFKGLEAAEKINNKIDMSTAVNNIGSWYYEKQDYKKAKPYLKRAIELCMEEEDETGAAWAMANIANCYIGENRYDSSYYYLSKAKEISEDYDFAELTQTIEEKFYTHYLGTGDYKKAIFHLQLSEKLKDEIENVDAQKTALRQKMEYDHQMQQKEQKLKREEEQKREAQLFYFILGGLVLSAVFGLLSYNRLRITKKQKRVIETQKQAVEEQKLIIEEKNGEILDSINYAKRVQEAILPSLVHFKDSFEDFFLFYKPKDIVAGDFYWFHQTEESIYFAVADCTGHGVPGALLSVVCANALERSVKENQNVSSGALLDEVSRYVIKRFEKEGSDMKDGMDIALCRIDRKNNILQYSGAYNPCLIVRENGMVELKADRRPVGKHIDESKFQTQEINCLPGDWVYLFTDGFPDQFGGDSGKKYKSSQFKNFLLSISSKRGEEQEAILQKELLHWSGDLEQVDDICVLGVRIGVF